MEHENPFTNVLKQLNQLMSVLETPLNAAKKISPKDLEGLKKDLDNLSAELDSVKRKVKIDPHTQKALRISVMRSKQTPAEDKQAFERSVQMTRQTRMLRDQLKKHLKKSPPAASKSSKKKPPNNKDWLAL